MPLFSVIIVNYNGRHLIGDCLDSLKGQSLSDFEIILIDNASRDGSVEFVKRHYPEVQLIECEENRGFGGGLNLGIEVSSGELIAVLNNDTVVDRNWLSSLRAAADGASADTGMYASKILNYEDPDIIDNTGLALYPDGVGRGRLRLQKDTQEDLLPKEVLCPSGCAGVYSREMLSEIGVFDEDLFLYLEDLDIGLRGRLAGWRCLYVPAAVVYHRYSATVEPYSTLKVYLVERNRIWILLKYFPVELIFLSLFFTLFRYTLQVYGALTGKGAGSRFVKQYSLKQALRTLLRAYVDAIKGARSMLEKRGQIRGVNRLGRTGFYKLLKRFSISPFEVTLRE